MKYSRRRCARRRNRSCRGCGRRLRTEPRRSRIWRSSSTREGYRRATSWTASPRCGPSGSKVLLALIARPKEDVETVRAFFRDLRGGGLGSPLLVVAARRPRSFGRSRSAFPARRASAAWPTAIRNLGIKVSAGLWPEFKARVNACFDDDSEACIAHLRLPVTYRRVTLTTNLLERLFGKGRRRLNIFPTASARGRRWSDIRRL